MRTRSQPLSPNGFLSLDTAANTRSRTNLRRRAAANKSGATATAVGDIDANAEATAAAEAQTTHTQEIEPSGSDAANASASATVATTRSAPRSTRKRTTTARAPTRRTTRATSTTVEEQQQPEEEPVKEERGRSNKRKAVAVDGNSETAAPRARRQRTTIEHDLPPPAPAPTIAASSNQDQALSASQTQSSQQQQKQEEQQQQQLHQPQLEKSSFSTLPSSSFEVDNEPRFFSQPIHPVSSMSTPQPEARSRFLSRTRSHSARPRLRRAMTPYAERQRRRLVEGGGRIEKTMFRIPELVKQNEEDVRKERGESARFEGAVAGQDASEEGMGVEALKKVRKENDEATRLRDEEDHGEREQREKQEASAAAATHEQPPSTPQSSHDAGGWKSLLSSVPRSLSRFVASPFKKKASTGQTPRTEGRIQRHQDRARRGTGEGYVSSPSFSRLASDFIKRPSFHGLKEAEKEEKEKKQERQPSKAAMERRRELEEKQKEEQERARLGYSLLPPALEIIPRQDDIVESIERSVTPQIEPQHPSSQDTLPSSEIQEEYVNEEYYDHQQGTKRKRQEREYEEAQHGARWEGYVDEEDEEADVETDGEDEPEDEPADAPSRQPLESQSQHRFYVDDSDHINALASFARYPDMPAIPEEPAEADRWAEEEVVEEHISPALKNIKRVRFDSSPQDTPSKLRAKRSAAHSLYNTRSSAISTPTKKPVAGLSFAPSGQRTSLGGARLWSPSKRELGSNLSRVFDAEDFKTPVKFATGAQTSAKFRRSANLKPDDTFEYTSGPLKVYPVVEPNKTVYAVPDDTDSSADEESANESDGKSRVGGEGLPAKDKETASLFSQSFSSQAPGASTSLFGPEIQQPPSTPPKKSIFTPTPVGGITAAPSQTSVFASPQAPSNFTANAGATPAKHDPAYLEKISKMRETAEKYKPKKSSGLRMSTETQEEKEESERRQKEEERKKAEAQAEKEREAAKEDAESDDKGSLVKFGETAEADKQVEIATAEKEAEDAQVQQLEQEREQPPENYHELLEYFAQLDWPTPQSYDEMFEDVDSDELAALAAAEADTDDEEEGEGKTGPASKALVRSGEQDGASNKSVMELVRQYWTPDDSEAAYKLFEREFERFCQEREEDQDTEEDEDEDEEDDEEEEEFEPEKASGKLAIEA